MEGGACVHEDAAAGSHLATRLAASASPTARQKEQHKGAMQQRTWLGVFRGVEPCLCLCALIELEPRATPQQCIFFEEATLRTGWHTTVSVFRA